MARNGSGTYSVVNTFVAGATITAAGHNQNWSDLATELTNSLALDGQSTMTGQIKAANGTVSAPSISFGSDLDTGFYRRASNSIGVALAGADYIEITTASVSIGQGVGIGGALAVGGTLAVSAASQLVGGVVLNGNLSVSATSAFTGVVTMASTLGVSATASMGAGTVSGAFTVTGAVSGGTVAGSMVATQAEQETGTSTTKIVTPGRQHSHPSASKSWVVFNNAGTIAASYNVSGVVKNSDGNYTISHGTDFSDANYAVVTGVQHSTIQASIQIASQLAGSVTVQVTRVDSGAALDPEVAHIVCFGDQA